MPLTQIPGKTEDSLGIVKQDVLPYTDPATQVPAVQYERLKDAVIANALAIGLGDGTTTNSLTKRVVTLEAAPANVGIKNRLISPEAVTVPARHQYIVHGSMSVEVGASITVAAGAELIVL